MKEVTDSKRISMAKNVVEPAMKYVSPDAMVTALTQLLQVYLNSQKYQDDDQEERVFMLKASGVLIGLLDELYVCYYD